MYNGSNIPVLLSGVEVLLVAPQPYLLSVVDEKSSIGNIVRQSKSRRNYCINTVIDAIYSLMCGNMFLIGNIVQPELLPVGVSVLLSTS